MQDLSNDFSHEDVRFRIGQNLLELLDADYFASYIWNHNKQKFVSCVQINMCPKNLDNYEEYFQFHDPITPALKNRRKATPVSHVMAHDRLKSTEFYNDFLKKDGLCYGMNYHAHDRGNHIGDIRIWRGSKKTDFGSKEIEVLNAIGPCFNNALLRATYHDDPTHILTYVQLKNSINITSREAEVADLITTGMSDEEICDKLHIAKPTLRSHIKALFIKTGMSRRTQFSPYLLQHQIGHYD